MTDATTREANTRPADEPRHLIVIRRALLSVSDKRDLAALAKQLVALGVSLISTGGTAAELRRAGHQITDVSTITGFPEMMDGRVKTLHPRIHGGLLSRLGQDDAALHEHAIEPIDLLISNLYPFAQAVQDPAVRYEEAVEHIDIGGPAMVRAAAKNHERVAVISDVNDYPSLMDELQRYSGACSYAFRQRMAAKAFTLTAAYDATVSAWLRGRVSSSG